MANPFVRGWKYFMALLSGKLDEHADPKIQIQQAIEEAQRQHQQLTQQAAAVIGNQRQLEMKLARQMSEVEKLQGSARQALTLADQARAAGDEAKAQQYEQTAQTFATQLVAAEQSMEDLKNLHDQSLQAAEQAKKAVEDNAQRVQTKLAERSKLLTQLEQAKMQEQVSASLSSMSQLSAPGSTPSLDEVRDKIEARYAKALGSAELASNSVEGRMMEVQKSTLDMAGPVAPRPDPREHVGHAARGTQGRCGPAAGRRHRHARGDAAGAGRHRRLVASAMGEDAADRARRLASQAWERAREHLPPAVVDAAARPRTPGWPGSSSATPSGRGASTRPPSPCTAAPSRGASGCSSARAGRSRAGPPSGRSPAWRWCPSTAGRPWCSAGSRATAPPGWRCRRAGCGARPPSPRSAGPARRPATTADPRSAAWPAVRRLEQARAALSGLLPLVGPAGRAVAEEAWSAAAEADLELRWQAARLAAAEPYRGWTPPRWRRWRRGCRRRRARAGRRRPGRAGADPRGAERVQDLTDRLHGLAAGLREVR
jgi:phage shock protein A